jgi:hypothetical protein
LGIAPRVLAGRCAVLWRQKLLLAVALNVWIAVPYYSLQYVHVFPITTMPTCGLDQLLPFTPGAAWPYLSLFMLLPIGPILMTRSSDLGRHAMALAAVGLVSNAIFFVLPTRICKRWACKMPIQRQRASSSCEKRCRDFKIHLDGKTNTVHGTV